MAREELIIHTFDKGIQSGIDQSDIESGAAAWNADIDCDSPIGTVQSRKDDTVALDATPANGDYCIQRHAWINREDGKKDLVFLNAKDNTIEAVTDFHGTATYSSVLGTPTGTSVTMETINRGVRIGQGDYAAKYVGYIDEGQFGGAAPSGLQYVDAELAPPAMFPTPHKVICTSGATTYMYGIEWKGHKILKITSASGAYIESTRSFVSLQAICDLDPNYFYVFEGLGYYGDIHKVAKSDLTVSETYHITGWGTVETPANSTGGTYLSDMELTTNYIWLGFWRDGGWTLAESGKIIYKLTRTLVANSNYIPTDITFAGVVDGLGVGGTSATLYASSPTIIYAGQFYPTSEYWCKPAKQMFAPGVTAGQMSWLGEVGLLSRVIFEFNYGGEYRSYEADARYGGRGIIMMNESSASTDLLDSTNTRFRSLATGVTSYTKPTLYGYRQAVRLPSSSTAKHWIFSGIDNNRIDCFTMDPTLTDCAWGDTTGATTHADFSIIQERLWSDYSYANLINVTKAAISMRGNVAMVLESAGADEVDVYTLMADPGSGKFAKTHWSGAGAYYGYWAVTYIYASSANITVVEQTDVDGTLDPTRTYFYKIAFEYDNYQMSPLIQTSPARIAGLIGATTDTVNIKLELYGYTSLSKRITGIQVYRADAVGSYAYTPTSLYRLVDRISITDSWSADSTESATWGAKMQFSIIDRGMAGPTYETETGCPETLPNNTVDYSISTQGNGYLFVGQSYNDEITQAANMIFRSKKNAPDTFDWSNDFCILPIMPIALYFFKGYLYAFDNSKMCVIDPEALVLIGEYDGYGVQSALAICSNEEAMFFANADNICMHDGKTPQVISTMINQVGTSVASATSHRVLAVSRTIQMVISSYSNALIIAYMDYGKTSGTLTIGRPYLIQLGVGGDVFTNVGAANNNTGTTFEATGTTPTTWTNSSVIRDLYVPMFVYSFIKRAWYFWQMSNVAGTNISYSTLDKRRLFIDYLGRVYISVFGGVVKLLGSATVKTGYWWTALINFGDDSTLKKIYKVILDSTTSLPCVLDYNNAQTYGTSVTSGSYLTNLTTKYRTIQLKFTLSVTYPILRGITILYRKMIGLR